MQLPVAVAPSAASPLQSATQCSMMITHGGGVLLGLPALFQVNFAVIGPEQVAVPEVMLAPVESLEPVAWYYPP